MPGITYDFDELPLLRTGRCTSMFVTGRAEIGFNGANDWWVERIELDGALRTGRLSLPQYTMIEVSPRCTDTAAYFKLIADALAREDRSEIEDEIRDQEDVEDVDRALEDVE